MRVSKPLPARVLLRIGAGLIGLGIALLPGTGRAAQRSADPRFGIVNAYEAPEAALESGASWEELTLRWDELQPSGTADWVPSSAIEAWLGEARSAGREVVAVLAGTPAWATDGTPGTGVPRGLYQPETDPSNTWASFVRQAVSHYSTRGINRWVIWDQQNILPGTLGSQWEGTTADYYQMVKVAYLVARQVNPNALIHIGGMSDNNPGWFGGFLGEVANDPSAPANNYYFDVVNVHIFFAPSRVYTLSANPSFLMDQAGIPLRPVWVSHTNARPGVDPVYPAGETFRQHPNITQEQQAAFIVQAHALAFAAQAERVGVYRLADNLDADASQAFGLVRSDGDPRPAFDAYRLVVEEFSGFVLARRVDEETHPLIDYVRLTFQDRVVHIAWALTPDNATLFIPARSTQAELIDMHGNRWTLTPPGTEYVMAVGGATCNDPTTVGGCLIGGDPWILVEEGVANPLGEGAPSVNVQLGGALPTPDPGPALTATALAMPTLTPTFTLTPPPEGTTSPQATAADPQVAEVTAAAPGENGAVPTAVPAAVDPAAGLRPTGLAAVLPYGLIGLGVLAIGGGLAYFFVGGRGRKPQPPAFENIELPGEEPPVQEEDTAEAQKTRKISRKKKPPEEI